MKFVTRAAAMALIAALMLLFAAACNTVDAEGLWENATYRRDVTLGKGDKTIEVEVKAGEESVTFTIKTDKEILADALLEHDLIEGEDGAYGLYVKKVNGILADYDVDRSYWALSVDGEYAIVGISYLEIADGGHYELTYTK